MPKRSKRKSSGESVVESLTNLVVDLTYELREIAERFIPKPASSAEDVVLIMVLLWALLSRNFAQQYSPIVQPQSIVRVQNRALTTEDVERIIKQCEKSQKPLECVKNMLYGG
jgi:integrase